jgi:hypothetical protein
MKKKQPKNFTRFDYTLDRRNNRMIHVSELDTDEKLYDYMFDLISGYIHDELLSPFLLIDINEQINIYDKILEIYSKEGVVAGHEYLTENDMISFYRLRKSCKEFLDIYSSYYDIGKFSYVNINKKTNKLTIKITNKITKGRLVDIPTSQTDVLSKAEDELNVKLIRNEIKK